MKRRSFLKSLAAVPAACLALPRIAEAALPKTKITRVRIYKPPDLNPLFNQSNMLVTVETDAGITGIGEGGAKDTLEQCAGSLIGKDPFNIEAIWQEEYMAWFYPPGTGEAARHGRARPRALGYQRQGPRPADPPDAGRRRAQLLRVLQHRQCVARRPGRAERSPRSRTACRPPSTRATSSIASARPIPATAPGTCAPASSSSPRDAKAIREALGTERRLERRFPPALRVCRRAARLPADRGIRALPGGRSRPRRAFPGGHSQAPPDDRRAHRGGRGVGLALGFQQARREPRHRLQPLHRCPTSAASPR